MFKLGKRSRENLVGVHPDLVRVVERAITITPIDFVVFEGRRTLARQRELVAAKASRTMNSRHLTGHAVDLVPIFEGKPSWREALFPELAKAVKKARAAEGVAIDWGFDLWGWDMPHWQLPRRLYP
jgi:peptidoglycan LD-endopeptidase CwlK